MALGIGGQLRQAREERGLSLQDVEKATRIRQAFLQAMEEDRFGDLPEVYGRGLLRNYAKFLGLDPEPLLKDLPSTVAREPVHVPYVLDEPLGAGRRAFRWWGLFLIVVVALAMVAAWYFFPELFQRKIVIPGVWPKDVTLTATPTRSQITVTLPASSPTLAALPMQTILSPSPTSTGTPTPRPPTPTLTATPSPTPTPIKGVYIEAIAQADTYLEVTVDGESVWIGILRAGERDAWQANEVIALRIGNAGGLQLLVNGVDVGPLGESGQVIDVEYRVGQLP